MYILSKINIYIPYSGHCNVNSLQYNAQIDDSHFIPLNKLNKDTNHNPFKAPPIIGLFWPAVLESDRFCDASQN